MQDPLDLSDAEFMTWAGLEPARWAVLPTDKREAWLEHLVARIRASDDSQQRNDYWRLAYVVACADAH